KMSAVANAKDVEFVEHGQVACQPWRFRCSDINDSATCGILSPGDALCYYLLSVDPGLGHCRVEHRAKRIDAKHANIKFGGDAAIRPAYEFAKVVQIRGFDLILRWTIGKRECNRREQEREHRADLSIPKWSRASEQRTRMIGFQCIAA